MGQQFDMNSEHIVSNQLRTWDQYKLTHLGTISVECMAFAELVA